MTFRLIQEEPKKETESVEVQTDLHPVESYISKDYTFSEWELKRRAIKLASLTKCTTKSQQTISKTRFQPEVGVQMTPVSNKETQTRRDGSCNHPGYPSFAWKLKTRASAADWINQPNYRISVLLLVKEVTWFRVGTMFFFS